MSLGATRCLILWHFNKRQYFIIIYLFIKGDCYLNINLFINIYYFTVFNRRAIIESTVRWRFSDCEKVFYSLWQLIMTFGNKTLWSHLPPPWSSKQQHHHAIVKEKQPRLFPYTHTQHKYAHTHACPFPLLQLYNLNATDSPAKSSRARLVIAVYFGMKRNSFIHYHVKLMASVSVEMNRRWEEIADRGGWSFLPAFTYSESTPP